MNGLDIRFDTFQFYKIDLITYLAWFFDLIETDKAVYV